MAYFDNAATTYPKPECVYSFMDEFYRKRGGSAGRGDHYYSMSAKGVIDDTRACIKQLLNCPSKQVVFEPTATISLNIIIQGIISKGIKNIYISPFEHNAVTRVLHHYEEKQRIVVRELAVSKSLQYDFERIRYQFDTVKPELVIVSHASNVIGLVSPVEKIFGLAKEYGAMTVADLSQTAGLVELNAGLETIDFAVFAGHKSLLGPTGIAGFIMKPDIDLPPILFGGTGYDSANPNMPEAIPEKYEMGTQNIMGIAGLNASTKWLINETIATVRARENSNRNKLLEILGRYDFLSTIGINEQNDYIGIVSCTFDGISSDSAGMLFSERNVSVRSGLQCSPLAHRFLGTYPEGTIRFSVNCFTQDNDFEQLKCALNSIEDEL